jgi:hypothetical protein
MPKFIIERDMPGVGKLADTDFTGAAQKSCDVLRAMGPEVQWIQSYVTGDKIYCVYHASDEKLIREHAERSGFPANRIHKVERVIDPATAEA